MYCRNCGNEIQDNAKFCPKCGAPVDVNASGTSAQDAGQAQQSQQQSNQQTQQQTYQNQNSCGQGPDWRAIASLVLGIVGIPLSFIPIGGGVIALIMGIVGIVFAARSRKFIGPTGVATAGLVFSIITLILGLRGLACLILMGAACGAMALGMNGYY